MPGRVWHQISGDALGITQQVVNVEQPVSDFRITLKAPPYRRGDGLAGLAAQARLLGQFDDDTAHGAHFVVARGNAQANAQLIVHAQLQAMQVVQVLEVFQAFEQAFFFLAGEQQNTLRVGRALLQAFATTDAGAWRAGLA